MTKKQFDKKYRELLKGVRKHLLKKGSSLYKCGGVDPKNYEDTYILPKYILCAALADCKWQYGALTEEGKKTIKNLEHF